MKARCSGTLARRAFLQAGLTGLASLTLSDLYRMEAATRSRSSKSIIVLWLWGGPSHMETFDLKPDAPAEYRGEFRPIATNVPGLQISEHLPRLAKLGDRFALVRSLSHNSPGHVNSTHTVMTGYPGELAERPPYRPKYPDAYSVIQHMVGGRRSDVPAFVALPKVMYPGSAYLGGDFAPLPVTSDPNVADFKLPSVVLDDAVRPRLAERLTLREQLDTLHREMDGSGAMESSDQFRQKAADMLLGPAARTAFDLGKEDPRTRDRYGRHTLGQRMLLARRLVEAGVRLVTVDFPCVPGQKAFSWDDHASVWNIFEQMKIRLPVLDQVASALIEDLAQRGLTDEVLFVIMGEMSHTPKLSNHQGQPGREHWGHTMSAFLSGGGLRMGQAVGATNRRGDEIQDRPLTPNDLLATWYHMLGIPLDHHFLDTTGRPVPILPHGTPIVELL